MNPAQRFRADYQGSEWLAYEKLGAIQLGAVFGFICLEHTAILSVSPGTILRAQ
ncbi:hypothetical protein O9993_08695 [Vibrio lentus]|nr:hypothetical protein [Vibrio lentus]